MFAKKKFCPLAIYISICALGMLFLHCSDDVIYGKDDEGYSEDLNAKDSAAIRAILDANGLQNKQVRDGIDLVAGFARKLTLDSFPLRRFVLPKALDSCISNFELIIKNSPVETLSIIDTIHQNLAITLHYTKLKSIPDCISLLQGRFGLYLSNNDITSISPKTMKCNVREIDVTYNTLCSIPDSLKTWIDQQSYTGNWQTTQKCGK
jgi:hypothetical protein